MALFFVKDEDGMVPQFNSGLDGFGEICTRDLTTRAVTASNVLNAFSNIPKKSMIEMLSGSNVKTNKSASKDDLLIVIQKNWQKIISGIVGVMGAEKFHEETVVSTTDIGCGAIFIKRNDIIYPTWHPTIKGFAIFEWKAPESIVTKPMLKVALNQVKKKCMEELLAHCGLRVKTTGSETWNTTDRVVEMLTKHWDMIMEKGGYKHPTTELPAPTPSIEPQEDDEDSGISHGDSDFPFAFINPYTNTTEIVILDVTRSLADICNELTEKYYRENEPLPRPSIDVMLPFGKADFDPMAEGETPHVSSLQASSSTEPEPPTAFKAFSGKPMKLNEKDDNENVKTFYLNEKGIDTVGKVVVEFPKSIGMSGDFYIFHFKKDDQWKALYDAMAEKTPVVLSDTDAVFCLRLPNKGSKTVSYETIGSWASLPSPLRMEIDMGLSGGGSGTRKSKDKVKMIAFQKAEVLKLAEKMKNEDRSNKSIDAIIAQNSEKMDLIWKMYESGNSMNVVETIMSGMPKQSLDELFEFSSSKPEQKLEHVVSVMLKSYIPETVKAHSALEATMSSSGSCLNLALKSFLVKNTGSVDWEALKRMADVEIKARLKKPSDVTMG
eukprot:symbB.v1.2.032222.t1/scaffold3839.1/size96963/1